MRKLALASVLLFGALISACAPKSISEPDESVIRIATVGPMSGRYASFGRQLEVGAEQAVSDINAAGGVLGKQLVLEIGDDRCDPKQAVAVAKDLADKRVSFVAGHFCSGSSIPASSVYENEGVVMISPASTHPRLTDDGGPNVFRVCGRDDQQGQVAGAFLAERFAGENVAVIHDGSHYGSSLARDTKKAMNAAGLSEKLYEAYTPERKDYSALVSKLKQNDIDVLYVGGYHTEAGLIVRQMRDQGMDTLLISGDALVTDQYWSITGNAGQGTLMTFSPDPRKNPVAAPIVESFRARAVEPEGYVLYTYAAIQVYVQAVATAKTTDLDKVLSVLNGYRFDTVLGELSFDDKGDVSLTNYVLYEWKDGRYDYLN
jgi:branched-chain amino acid transport system substrate-binding protein